MGRNEEDEDYDTYTVVMCTEADGIPVVTARIKIPKFYVEYSKAWLTWRMRFKVLQIKC